MMRRLTLIALSVTAAVSAPAWADDAADVDAAVAALYGPYSADAPDWDAVLALKNYSTETETLIAEWEKGLPPDEVTDLADFDWLCECQDWDAAAFKFVILPHPAPADGKVEVTVRIDIGWDEAREQSFLMVKQGEAWKVDDLFSQSFPDGLKAALREATANPDTP